MTRRRQLRESTAREQAASQGVSWVSCEVPQSVRDLVESWTGINVETALRHVGELLGRYAATDAMDAGDLAPAEEVAYAESTLALMAELSTRLESRLPVRLHRHAADAAFDTGHIAWKPELLAALDHAETVLSCARLAAGGHRAGRPASAGRDALAADIADALALSFDRPPGKLKLAEMVGDVLRAGGIPAPAEPSELQRRIARMNKHRAGNSPAAGEYHG